jgi:O-antigen/teichoic acid export membrane protein
MASVIERTVKGGAGFFTANVIRRGLGFLFVVVATRVLGPAEFGVLALGLSVMGVVRRVAAFGLPKTIQRFMSGEGEDRSAQLYGTILLTGSVSAVLAGTALYVASPELALIFEQPSLAGPLRVLSFVVVVAVGFSLLRSLLQAQERVRWIVVVDTAQSAAKVGLLCLLFLGVQSAMSAAWAVAGAFGTGLVLAGSYVRKLDFRPSFDALVTDARTVLSYSAPLVVVGFSYFLSQQTDRLMLGWLADASSVGIYTVTSKLAMSISTFRGALISIFMPVASAAFRNEATQQMRRSYLFIGKWGGVASGAALLIFTGAGPWLLQLFGVEYATNTTYRVLVVLSGIYFIGAWVGPTGALLQMSDGHRVELVNTIVFIVANVTLNYVLITAYGVIGAAVATLLSELLRNAIQVCEIAYWYGITPFAPNNLAVLGITGIGTVGLMLTTAGLARMGFALGSVLVLGAYVLWTATGDEWDSIQRLMFRAKTAVR